MTDILTITLNPAIDYAASVPHVAPGPKLYCSPPRIDPGGGGVNVARTIVKLGGSAKALVVAGGAMGARLLSLLAAEQVPSVEVRVAGETRYSLAVTDAQSGEQFRFSLPGEPLSAQDADRVLGKVSRHAPRDGLVVLSGGVPDGLPDDFPQQVQAALTASGARLVVDTSKAALHHLLTAPRDPLDMLRLDRSEIETALACPMTTLAQSADVCAELVARGVARIVVAGHGAEGSVMASGAERFVCRAPTVPVRSKVGAGDALVGAFTLALARGEAPGQALRWGVAAAAATVSTEGTSLCTSQDTERLRAECRLEPL